MQTDTAILTVNQAIIFAIFGLTMIAFIWGRIRYDIVALTALVVAVLADLLLVPSMLALFEPADSAQQEVADSAA